MSDDTPTTILPAASYEQAYPLLRRPYLASQVWAKVQTAPKNPNQPCTIALYSIGETLMDRLNLICAREWGEACEKTAEAKNGSGRETRWYCEVQATLTVFGKTKSDIGKGVAPTRAGAEMNARAQAYKRAGRKFGPGQCLYACDEIIMFRGDGENELRFPTGDGGHLNPYFDEEGHGRRYVRSRYEAWLREYGEAVYGEPLNHLELAMLLQTQAASLTVAIPNGVAAANTTAGGGHPPRLTDHGASLTTNNGNGGVPAIAEPQTAATPSSPQAAGTDAPTARFEVMPDYPAPMPAIQAAEIAGYSELVARILCNLAREERQGERFLRSQLNVVENWLTVLHGLDVPEDVLIGAALFNARKRTSQERRQALFSQWIAGRAAGATEAASGDEPADTAGAGTKDTVGEPTADRAEPAPEPAANARADLANAIAELQGRMAEHEFGDLPVTRLAALAVGAGPQAQVTWAKMKPELLRVVSDLLDCAAALGWDSKRLDREVLEAHSSTRQQSAAGRFSAFANQLKDMAETRQLEGA